jgi:hypothetical protein
MFIVCRKRETILKKTIFMRIIVASMLFASIGVLNAPASVYAQDDELKKGPLKEFNPGEDPKIPGWDPDRVEEDAPGQLKKTGGEDQSAADVSPGHEAQEAGVIGNCDPTEDKDCHRGND